MWTIAIFFVTVFLAYANGANDNFKGVATLFGSKTTNYKFAIWWATATTFAGSLCSVILANALLQSFSGKGLVPDAIADTNSFHLAVAFGAAVTVIKTKNIDDKYENFYYSFCEADRSALNQKSDYGITNKPRS